MWIQFAYTNIHFGLNIFAGFVFFLIAWLFFDAWISRKGIKNIGKALGFLLLSLSFFAHATVIESGVIETFLLRSEIAHNISLILKNVGLLCIFVSLVADPLQKRPDLSSGTKLNSVMSLLTLPMLKSIMLTFSPILSSLVALLFLRQATLGYESHIRKVALGMFLFSISEVLGALSILRDSSNNFIYELVGAYQEVWITEHILLGLSLIILGLWSGTYLLKRLQSQLFIFFTSFVIIIFLITTVSFTGLLLRDLEAQAFEQTHINGKVLQYALNAKGSERISDAQGFANIPQIAEQIKTEERDDIFRTAEGYLLSKKLDTLYVLNSDGKVIVSAHDRGEFGQSLSDDGFFLRAKDGEGLSGFRVEKGVIYPSVSVVAASPVYDEDAKLSGAIIVSSLIDNAFVDGIEESTGLSASIYGENIMAATTLTTPDGNSRANGTVLANEKIVSQVLKEGLVYSGVISVFNTDYVASILPLSDLNKKPVGMIFVGNPQIHLLRTAGQSIELTFIVGALLIIFSIIPSVFIAKKIAEQIK